MSVIFGSPQGKRTEATGDPGGDRSPMQYINTGWYPVYAPPSPVVKWAGKLPVALWSEVSERHRIESLRSLAPEYGVSHESVRRALNAAKTGLPQPWDV
jgi:hypothetical protein